MSKSFRFFVNNQRVSTAVKVLQGYILQVYPEKKQFATESEWRKHWEDASKPSIRVETDKEEWTYTRTKKHTAPPGKYYIGDLCYVLSDEVYTKVFGDMGDFKSGLYKNRNNFFFTSSTVDGDGLFTGTNGHEFGVDSGTIGITPVSCIEKDDYDGRIYEFKYPVDCYFSRGVFRFSSSDTKFEIQTNED